MEMRTVVDTYENRRGALPYSSSLPPSPPSFPSTSISLTISLTSFSASAPLFAALQDVIAGFQTP